MIYGTMFCSLALILIYLFQRNLIYIPNANPPHQAAYGAQDMQTIEIETRDHLRLQAWYKKASPSRPTILYLHGNAGHIGYRMNIVRPLLKQGYGVLLLEYRGYGGNPGKPTEAGLYEDARTAIEFLKQHHTSMSQMILFGESLGCAIAVQMALENNACALILQTPFTSLTDVAHVHYPWLFFMSPWDKYDSIHKIDQIRMPILIIHGTDDQVVPYAQGRALFEKAHSFKTLLTLKNRNHYDLWHDDKLLNQLIEFIQNLRCN